MERTAADILKLGEMDPELATYLETNPPAAIPLGVEIPTRRKIMNEMLQSKRQPPPPEVVEEEITVPARDGFEVPVLLHKPSSGTPGPLVVFLHPGGYTAGAPIVTEPRCRMLVKRFGAVCLNVDYRLAPEHPFPTPVNDSWDVTKWAAANASKIGADPAKGFIVGGMSAGGQMADIIGHLARDENLSPPVTGIVEACAMIFSEDVVPLEAKGEYLSQEQNKANPPFTRELWDEIEVNYKPDHKSPLWSSYNNPNGHKNLAPVYFQVAGGDVVRDDSLIHEKILRTQAGVKTKMDVYPGLPHNFDAFYPTLAATKKAGDDFLNGFGWLLGLSP